MVHSMLNSIITAIKKRKLLVITYGGITRTVEPHTAGISKKRNNVLSCYQTHGKHIKPGHEWDFFTISKITNLTVLEDSFSDTRTGYKRNDSRMTTIYAEL